MDVLRSLSGMPPGGSACGTWHSPMRVLLQVAHQTVVAKVFLSKVRRLHGVPARTVSQRGMRLQLRVLGWISVPPLFKLRPSLRAALETAPRPVTDALCRRWRNDSYSLRRALANVESVCY